MFELDECVIGIEELLLRFRNWFCFLCLCVWFGVKLLFL